MAQHQTTSAADGNQEIIRNLRGELTRAQTELMRLTDEMKNQLAAQESALNAARDELKRNKARLDAVTAELESFSYSVSHDLRAPLRHLQGFAQALREDCADSLDPEAQGYLTHLTEAAQQMNSLINDILTFSRLSKQALQESEVDFAQLVTEVIKELKPQQGSRKIEWVVQALPVVRGDLVMLRQVWTNLISNAIKFSRNAKCARIEIGCQKPSGSEQIFFVRDNGAGFDMNYYQKLFGLFQRLHRRDHFEGAGLGLANVRRIVDRHGGRTWAEGKIDEGATFYFSLPTNPERR
jgi:light-regulated signal transduction histidine kinase (bacteriophytochrome)